MSDDLNSMTDIATHVGGGLGSGGLGAWLMHMFKSRKEDEDRRRREDADQKTRDSLTELKTKMDRLLEDVGEHKKFFETVVTTKNAVETLGQKLDDLRERVGALETRKGPRR